MILHEGDAHSFLEYFHNRQTTMSVALLLLTMEPDDPPVITSVLNSVTALDQALGEDVGLFLFGPAFGTPLAVSSREMIVMSGVRRGGPQLASGRTGRVRDFFANMDPRGLGGPYEQAARAAVARSTVSVVPQFATIFDLDGDDLPVMCIVVRGAPEAIVVPCKDSLDVRKIIDAARILNARIHSLLARTRIAADGLANTQRQVEAASRWENENRRSSERLLTIAAEMEQEHGVILRPQLVALLRTGRIDGHTLESILAGVPDAWGGDRGTRSRMIMRSCVAVLEENRQRLADLTSPGTEQATAERTRFLADLHGEIADAVAKFEENGGLGSRTADFGKWVKRLVDIATTGQKAWRLLLEEGSVGRALLRSLRDNAPLH